MTKILLFISITSVVYTDYLTPGEVASFFNIHERTVRKWACKGRLKRYRYGHNTTFYKRHELISVLNSMNL